MIGSVLKTQLDPDPHGENQLDTDPQGENQLETDLHGENQLDPDPQKINADPQPWAQQL